MQQETTTCFHHTDRPTGRRCTRCGRPACPECLRDAPVGSQCWECVRGAQPPRTETWRRRLAAERLLVTKSLIATNVVVFALLVAAGASATGSGTLGPEVHWSLFGPAVADGEWWRIVTSGFLHYGLIHLGFNMLVLYQVGLVLEPGIGRARFATIYFVALLGGSFVALYLDPIAHTGGASGAVFGVAGAATLALWRRGVSFWQTGYGPLVAINLLLTFTIPNVSVGGHLGGLAAGTVAGWALLDPRRAGRPVAQGYAIAALLGVASLVGALWAAAHWQQLA